MLFLKKILFTALLYCFTSIVLAQNISVDDTKTAANLAQILTNSSSCVSVSGEKATGNTDIPIMNSYGSFDKNSSGFPFANGIILSTWNSIYSVGPFVREPANTTKSGSVNWKGDTDLENALNKGNTLNATVLEFDFIPQTNYISFNYLFASNEYQDDFPCHYSDGFAFLIKENTIGSNYQNLAVLSDGTAVSSQTVHPAFNFNSTTCSAVNEYYFGQLNTSPTNTSSIDYSGQTKILTAQSVVKAGISYHIKLVIADQNGNLYDSAVFLEAGSFSSKIDLGQDHLLATDNPVCFGDSLILDTGLTGITNTYKWFKDGGEIFGATSSTYTVTEAGLYKVEATLSGCIVTGQIKIEYTPEIILTDTSLIKCDDNGSGIATFALPENVIKSNIDFTLYHYYSDSSLTNPILNPSAYSASDGTIVYVKVTNSTSYCPSYSKITLHVTASYPFSSTILAASPIINDFSGNGNSVTLVPPSGNGTYEYSLDGKNYQTPSLFTNLAIGEYTAYIRDTKSCQYLTYLITLLDYPHFFTPNGDGFNDIWEIKNLSLSNPSATISIFDRYGKLLKQLNANESWNGKYIGKELPADDYWFHVNLADGRIIKGHFSLKR